MPGYKGVKSSDPIEQGLRDRWYSSNGRDKDNVGLELSAYLWRRVQNQVAEDRARHPRAKRNAAVGSDLINCGGGRILP